MEMHFDYAKCIVSLFSFLFLFWRYYKLWEVQARDKQLVLR